MTSAISVSHLDKTYASGFQALRDINLDIRHGEIFALLGPNGAGKTTLISIICGIVNPSAGSVTVEGHNIIADYRAARSLIGLVPQELTTDAFETPPATMRFSRGLFGKPADPGHIEKVLKQLSLWDKKDAKIRMLSGGMKRRLMIAKALSHEPRISLVEDKAELMRKLGKKQLTLELREPLVALPAALAPHNLTLAAGGRELTYTYDTKGEHTGITALLDDLGRAGIKFTDLRTTESSLEDIFVGLVSERR
jgi:ABC-2 type transport system ATP-binding protein